MSHNVSKTVLRAKIDELHDTSDTIVLQFLREKGFLEPAELDYDPATGEVNYFYYEANPGSIVPIYDYDTKNWGIDFVFSRHSEYSGDGDVSISMETLKEKIEFLERKFGKRDWKIHSYTYYNGADEPVNF